MHEGRTVFAQLMDWLPKYEFDKCVRRHHGDFRAPPVTQQKMTEKNETRRLGKRC